MSQIASRWRSVFQVPYEFPQFEVERERGIDGYLPLPRFIPDDDMFIIGIVEHGGASAPVDGDPAYLAAMPAADG